MINDTIIYIENIVILNKKICFILNNEADEKIN
jgi:hypothetical protein